LTLIAAIEDPVVIAKNFVNVGTRLDLRVLSNSLIPLEKKWLCQFINK